MNERAAFVDRWEEYCKPLKTELIYFQCIVWPTSGLHDNRLGGVYCVMISVIRILTKSSKFISKSAFAKHGVLFWRVAMFCVQTERLTFPHGTTVQVRCRELGVYKLLGDSALQCQNGAWNHRIPACIPTTILTNFTGKCAKVLVWFVCVCVCVILACCQHSTTTTQFK